MDTDRELLEWAAKAAGITGTWQDWPISGLIGSNIGDMDVPWNPLRNDGQALRLAVKLGIGVLYSDFTGEAGARWNRGAERLTEYGSDEPYAATRRAIVRAAAEIGKALK